MMNLDEAIQAHAAWKIKLQSYLHKPDNSVNPAEVGRDDRCPLGQWLHGEAKKTLSALPEYKTLLEEHAHFHRTVAKVVEHANAGNKAGAEHMLEVEGEFATASRKVVGLIMQMKKKVAVA
jgi:Chemoreceptor zinc-binding domain